MPTVLLILSLTSVMLAYFLGLTKAELKQHKPVTEEKIEGTYGSDGKYTPRKLEI